MAKSGVDGVSPGCFRFVCRGLQVFGSLLLLGGALAFSTPIGYIRDALRMHDWEPAPAVVETAELKRTAEDSNRYAHAVYRYTFRGVQHTGDRVDPAGHMFGAIWQQDSIAEKLQSLQRSATPTTCYVNPDDPSESVLDPQFNFSVLGISLIAPSLFSFFGLCLFVIGALALRRERRLAVAQDAYPNEPWKWRDDWAAGLIHTENYKSTWLLVTAAIIFLFVGLPIGLLILSQRGWPLVSWPTGVLLFIGWGFFNGTRMALKASKKWKRATFRLGAPHGLVGGPLAGVVELPHNTSIDATFRIRLECYRILHGNDSGPNQETIWHDQNTVQPTRSSERVGNTVIPVYFAIPFSCEPTDPFANQRIRWRLIVDEGENNSPRAVFDVPVFKTAASSRTYKEDRTVLQPYEPAENLEETIAACCRVEPLPGEGEELRFTMFQPLILFIALAVIAVCTAGITALLYYHFHPAWTIMPAIFMLMIVAGTFEMLFWGSRLSIRPDQITIAAGIAGFRKLRTVPRELFSRKAVVETSKEWQRQQTTDWHSIRLIVVVPNAKFDETKVDPEDKDFDLNGEPRLLPPERLVVAKRIDSRRTAERLADWLREKLELARAVESVV